MFNLVSLAIGLVALPLALIAFTPLLGALNWLVAPIAIVGLAFGLLSSHRSGRRLNGAVLVIAILRLILGHGLL